MNSLHEQLEFLKSQLERYRTESAPVQLVLSDTELLYLLRCARRIHAMLTYLDDKQFEGMAVEDRPFPVVRLDEAITEVARAVTLTWADMQLQWLKRAIGTNELKTVEAFEFLSCQLVVRTTKPTKPLETEDFMDSGRRNWFFYADVTPYIEA